MSAPSQPQNPASPSQPPPGESGFPGGAYRANLYVYDPCGRIDWYAIAPQSFSEGKYFTLGRSPDCNIVLNDGSVSAHHAYIAAERSELYLRDLGSTNGVVVNEEKMSDAALRHGDVLRMGATDIRFLFSYKEGPVQLVLEFLNGANAGRSLATYGSSTTIGRLNCAVNLQGRGLAPQHVRIDAYGPELMYVVNLRRENETLLNGVATHGITTARDGDVLGVGDHQIRLRVVDAETAGSTDEVPTGLGTLQLSSEGAMKAVAPVAQILISADDLRRLDAAALARSSDDNTALEMFSPGEVIRSPTGERDSSRPPPPPVRPLRSATAGPPHRHAPVGGHPPAEAPQTPKRAIWPWLVALPLFMFVGATIALRLTSVHRELALEGDVVAAFETPLTAPVRSRVEQLSVKVGDRVAARDRVATLIDLDAEAELAGLTAQIEAAQRPPAPGSAVMVGGRVAPALVSALSRAEVDLSQARAALDETSAAFNRREVTFEAVNAARRAVAELERVAAEKRAAVAAAGERRRVVLPAGHDDGDGAERLNALLAQRAAAEKRMTVVVEAPRGGVLLTLGTPDLRVGTSLRRDQPLFVLGEVSRVKAILRVPPESLATVEGTGRAILTPLGFKEPRVPVTFGKAGPAALPDGAFSLEMELENPNGHFRPGQKVRAELELPSVDALTWLLHGRGG